MSNRFGRTIFRTLFITLTMLSMSAAAFAANTIYGGVYDNKNNPLVDVYVSLLNEFGAEIQHQITDSAGRYQFAGLADGTYGIRVRPFRYDFDEETRSEIRFSSFSVTGGTGSDSQSVDFNLNPRRSSLAYAETAASVVFVQEIPSDAKKAFNEGRSLLKKKDVDGAVLKYQEAVKIFPRYFDARFALGEIYLARKDWDNAKTNLLIAADVNNKSPRSFYMLGVTLSAFGDSINEPAFNKAALISLNQALTLAPASTEVLLVLAHVETAMSKFDDAEKHLLLAKKVATQPNPEIFKNLAYLYGYYLKRYAEAAVEMENFIKALPDNDSPQSKKEIENYKKVVKQMRDRAAAEKTSTTTKPS